MIEKVIICSLIVTAIYSVMQPDMIFEKVAYWFEDHLPAALHKPVFDCLTCMGGIWGFVVYWIAFHGSVGEWIAVNISVIGLNAIIARILYSDADEYL